VEDRQDLPFDLPPLGIRPGHVPEEVPEPAGLRIEQEWEVAGDQATVAR
jgi:hypothetical protein